MAFEVPLASLVGASAVGDGLAMTAAAILGKFLSGAWAAPLVSPEVLGHRWHVHICCQPGDTPTVRLAFSPATAGPV